jgi:hypothetical protein
VLSEIPNFSLDLRYHALGVALASRQSRFLKREFMLTERRFRSAAWLNGIVVVV